MRNKGVKFCLWYKKPAGWQFYITGRNHTMMICDCWSYTSNVEYCFTCIYPIRLSQNKLYTGLFKKELRNMRTINVTTFSPGCSHTNWTSFSACYEHPSRLLKQWCLPFGHPAQFVHISYAHVYTTPMRGRHRLGGWGGGGGPRECEGLQTVSHAGALCGLPTKDGKA